MKRLFAVILLLLAVLLTSCASRAERWQEQYDLAMSSLEEGNTGEALETFTKAVGIDKKNPLGYAGRAAAYLAPIRAQGDKRLASMGAASALAAMKEETAAADLQAAQDDLIKAQDLIAAADAEESSKLEISEEDRAAIRMNLAYVYSFTGKTDSAMNALQGLTAEIGTREELTQRWKWILATLVQIDKDAEGVLKALREATPQTGFAAVNGYWHYLLPAGAVMAGLELPEDMAASVRSAVEELQQNPEMTEEDQAGMEAFLQEVDAVLLSIEEDRTIAEAAAGRQLITATPATFRQALEQLKAAGKDAALVLEPGDYYVPTIALNGLTNILVQGHANVRLLGTKIDDEVIHIENCTDITLRGLTIGQELTDQANTSWDSPTLGIENSTGVTVDLCDIYGSQQAEIQLLNNVQCRFTGTSIRNSAGSAVQAWGSECTCSFEQCFFNGNGYWWSVYPMISNSSSTVLDFTGCTFQNNKSSRLSYYDFNSFTDCTTTDNGWG